MEAYPRPDGRGPIEASPTTDWWGRILPTIRDLTVAAPLKPELVAEGPQRPLQLSAT